MTIFDRKTRAGTHSSIIEPALILLSKARQDACGRHCPPLILGALACRIRLVKHLKLILVLGASNNSEIYFTRTTKIDETKLMVRRLTKVLGPLARFTRKGFTPRVVGYFYK